MVGLFSVLGQSWSWGSGIWPGPTDRENTENYRSIIRNWFDPLGIHLGPTNTSMLTPTCIWDMYRKLKPSKETVSWIIALDRN